MVLNFAKDFTCLPPQNQIRAEIRDWKFEFGIRIAGNRRRVSWAIAYPLAALVFAHPVPERRPLVARLHLAAKSAVCQVATANGSNGSDLVEFCMELN